LPAINGNRYSEGNTDGLYAKIAPFKLKGEVVALRPIPYQNPNDTIAIAERK
jgi:hypothetical protein